jgi:toxin ParE1/3/4
MDWGIIWSAYAEKQLDAIFNYYLKNANYRVAKSLVSGIIEAPVILLSDSEIGQAEDLLLHLNKGYRYLVYKSYKIIYRIDQVNNLIMIDDVFDTRRKPTKISQKK